MFLKSLQWRLVSFFCLITFSLIVPIGLFLNKQVEDSYYTKFQGSISKGFANWHYNTENPDRDTLIRELDVNKNLFSADEINKSYTITDNKGRLIATNDPYFKDNTDAVTNILLESDNFVQAMTGVEKNRKILEKNGDTEFFDYASPKGDFILYFKYYKDDWIGIIDSFNKIIFTALIIAMAVAFVMGYLLSKTITVPIGKLMNKAKSIAAGDFGQLLEVKSNDEISKLTESFNFMSTSLKGLEDMRREFVANVSHELRTPLTSIKSYAEALLDGALDDREAAEKFLGVINSEADRMTRLVRDLLQLSRLDNQQMKWDMEEISFVNLVKSAVERMGLEAENKSQLLECHVLGDVPNIEADYGRLEQVVFNLLSNAIKYTPEGGRISVFIGKTPNEVYMKVTDTGIGIPEEDLPRIFERFYRVDKARSREMGGTGLGLAIAKEIVEAHSGAISITSEKDRGTEIIVRLPIVQPLPEYEK